MDIPAPFSLIPKAALKTVGDAAMAVTLGIIMASMGHSHCPDFQVTTRTCLGASCFCLGFLIFHTLLPLLLIAPQSTFLDKLSQDYNKWASSVPGATARRF